MNELKLKRKPNKLIIGVPRSGKSMLVEELIFAHRAQIWNGKEAHRSGFFLNELDRSIKEPRNSIKHAGQFSSESSGKNTSVIVLDDVRVQYLTVIKNEIQSFNQQWPDIEFIVVCSCKAEEIPDRNSDEFMSTFQVIDMGSPAKYLTYPPKERKKYKYVPIDDFTIWANKYFNDDNNIDRQILRAEMTSAFYLSTPGIHNYVSRQKFKMKLYSYCADNNLLLNAKNGGQAIRISGAEYFIVSRPAEQKTLKNLADITDEHAEKLCKILCITYSNEKDSEADFDLEGFRTYIGDALGDDCFTFIQMCNAISFMQKNNYRIPILF